MKPFSEKPRCEKCGSLDVSRVYHDAKDDGAIYCGGYPSRLPAQLVEHHKMHCRGCGFAWQEECKPNPEVFMKCYYCGRPLPPGISLVSISGTSTTEFWRCYTCGKLIPYGKEHDCSKTGTFVSGPTSGIGGTGGGTNSGNDCP